MLVVYVPQTVPPISDRPYPVLLALDVDQEEGTYCQDRILHDLHCQVLWMMLSYFAPPLALYLWNLKFNSKNLTD